MRRSRLLLPYRGDRATASVPPADEPSFDDRTDQLSEWAALFDAAAEEPSPVTDVPTEREPTVGPAPKAKAAPLKAPQSPAEAKPAPPKAKPAPKPKPTPVRAEAAPAEAKPAPPKAPQKAANASRSPAKPKLVKTSAKAGKQPQQPTRWSTKLVTESTTRRVVGVGVLVILLSAAITGTVIATRGQSDDNADRRPPGHHAVAGEHTTATGANPLSAAVSWMKHNIGPSARISAPRASLRMLAAAGFTRVTRDSIEASGARWLVMTPRTVMLQSTLEDSVPVALFGGGTSSAVQVRVLPKGNHVDQFLNRDVLNRRHAERDLLRNTELRVQGRARALLQSGRLDLRAATFLVLLTQSAPVRLTDIHENPAEASVGRPARTITVTVRGSALRMALAGLPARFRPAHAHHHGDHVTVTWPVMVNPIQPVS